MTRRLLMIAVCAAGCGGGPPSRIGTFAWAPGVDVTIPPGIDVARITPDSSEYMLPDLGVLELANDPAPAVGCQAALDGEFAMQGALRDAGQTPEMNMVVHTADWQTVAGKVKGLVSTATLLRDDLALQSLVFCAGDRKLGVSLTVTHLISPADVRVFDAVVASIKLH